MSAAFLDDPDELARLRHDFKNHLTAMRSGCVLVRRGLDRDDLDGARAYLDKMEEELRAGFALVERLRGGE